MNKKKYEATVITVTLDMYEKQMLLAAASMYVDRFQDNEKRRVLQSAISKINGAPVQQPTDATTGRARFDFK